MIDDIQVAATNRLLEALQDSENRMRRRLNLLMEIIFELNNDGEIVFSNAAWEKVLGYKSVDRTNLTNYIHPADLSIFNNAIFNIGIDQENTSNILIRFNHADNHVLVMSASFVLIESGIIGTLHDVTKQIEVQNDLVALAHYDPLTKLPNRILLGDRINQAIINAKRHNHQVAVIFIDLDDFKAINDTYGHQIGDAVLIEFGNLIRRALRETDSIARLGGDEFIILLTELESTMHCDATVKRIFEIFQKAISISDIQIQLKGSIGITLYPNDNVDADQLVRHADQAMYLAKQAGKNQVQFFDTYSNSQIISKNAFFNQIENAISNHQFVFHYQPKIDIESNRIFGVEALIRWQHPEKGVISPGLFLPFIEDHPLSLEIGKLAVENAVAQTAQWNELGLCIEISVNISGHQIFETNFYEFVTKALSNFPSVKPSQLQIEIVESSAISNLEHTSKVMKCFNKLGISFALDDFGTGFSSLSHLRSLPIHTLKIDQSFILNMPSCKEDLSIVKSIIALSEAFNCKVLAEGVENQETLQLLQSLGCHAAQGFFYSPALPSKDLYKFATSNIVNR